MHGHRAAVADGRAQRAAGLQVAHLVLLLIVEIHTQAVAAEVAEHHPGAAQMLPAHLTLVEAAGQQTHQGAQVEHQGE